MVHGARGRQADGIGDLANRGWIPPLLDGLRDAVEDPLSSILVMPGHVLLPSRVGPRCVSSVRR
jgi:hypothetical protein